MKPRYRFVERLKGPPGHDGVYVFECVNFAEVTGRLWSVDRTYDRELRYVDMFWGNPINSQKELT